MRIDHASEAPECWCVGEAECISCGHEWVAVWPMAADSLECPACHSTDTDRTIADAHERSAE